MGEPASISRRMMARAWSASSNDEEARSQLQDRMVTMSKLMFYSFIAMIAFMETAYVLYPIEPKSQDAIRVIAAIGVAMLAFTWYFLATRPVAMPALFRMDAFYSAGTGTVFAAIAFLSRDLEPSPYICFIYTILVVLLRSTVVPSTGRRTTISGVVSCAPIVISAVAIAISPEGKLPGPVFVCGAILIVAVVVALATVSSRMTYGLRREASVMSQLGVYTLVHKIGEGGMGTVYRARHALLRRQAAVKLLHADRVNAETLERFEREVQLTSQLTHPNTVAVFDYGHSRSGYFYYVMEYLDGIDLERLVARYGPQPADRVIHILLQVCGALGEAHRGGIMHRDIKPANIIVCERGGVPDFAKVVDFGLVQEITANDGASSRVILGTPHYIAPEAVIDLHRVGPPADIYALGAVGYYLLTGKHVYEGATTADICLQHVNARPVPPSRVAAGHVPAGLERVILDCLHKEPEDRPDAEELATRLRAVDIAGDWNTHAAARWWSTFHEQDSVEPSESLTITVPIDLGRRGPEAPPRPARSRQRSTAPPS